MARVTKAEIQEPGDDEPAYSKASELVQYADNLAQARLSNWVTSQSVLIGLIAAGLKDLEAPAVIVLGILGLAMCVAWWISAKPIALKIHETNTFISREFPSSTHAAYLRAFDPVSKPLVQQPYRRGPTRWMSWFVPAVFGIAWLVLIAVKMWMHGAPDACVNGTPPQSPL